MASFAMAFGRRRKLIPTVICVEAGSRRSCRPLNVRFALDSVAKLFWAPERATLIQDQSPLGNVDSEMCSSRFDYCWLANRPGVLQHYPLESGQRADVPVRPLGAAVGSSSRASAPSPAHRCPASTTTALRCARDGPPG